MANDLSRQTRFDMLTGIFEDYCARNGLKQRSCDETIADVLAKADFGWREHQRWLELFLVLWNECEDDFVPMVR